MNVLGNDMPTLKERAAAYQSVLNDPSVPKPWPFGRLDGVIQFILDEPEPKDKLAAEKALIDMYNAVFDGPTESGVGVQE